MSETDQAEHGGILISTGGPVSAHHLLLHLAREHRVTLHVDVSEVDNGANAAASLEIWQTANRGSGRWRWLLLRAGAVIEEAPGEAHRLLPYDPIVLTVIRSMLPDREAVKHFR